MLWIFVVNGITLSFLFVTDVVTWKARVFFPFWISSWKVVHLGRLIYYAWLEWPACEKCASLLTSLSETKKSFIALAPGWWGFRRWRRWSRWGRRASTWIWNKWCHFVSSKNSSPTHISSMRPGACIIKLITAVIYGFCNELECLSLASHSSLV
jgi:hypothetical protein